MNQGFDYTDPLPPTRRTPVQWPPDTDPRPRPYRDRRSANDPPLADLYREHNRDQSEFVTNSPLPLEPEPPLVTTPEAESETQPVVQQPGLTWFNTFLLAAFTETVGMLIVFGIASHNQTMLTVGIIGVLLDVPLALVLAQMPWFLPSFGPSIRLTAAVSGHPALTEPEVWATRPPPEKRWGRRYPLRFRHASW